MSISRISNYNFANIGLEIGLHTLSMNLLTNLGIIDEYSVSEALPTHRYKLHDQ